MTTTTLAQRKLVRQAAGERNARQPVYVIDGAAAPHYTGRSYYWTTPSGKTEVRHPNAYGWPTVYHASTLRLVVGADWLAAQESFPRLYLQDAA